MTIIPEGTESFVGIRGEAEEACDPVERGAVRRYSQAIMDSDPIYYDEKAAARYGGPVAPPLFPTAMFRRRFGTPDPFDRFAANANYDGASGGAYGPPEITAFRGWNVLNGGSEVEMFRYVNHGERLRREACYEEIFEKETSKGPMVFLIILADYYTDKNELVMRVRRTTIRRPV
jgi:hypothetical protein